MNQRNYLVLTVFGVVLASCSFPGQRVLDVRLEQDGRLVAQGFFSVPDSFDRQASWQRLEGVPLESVGQIAPDPSDPNVAVLNGKIRLSLIHADRTYAAANVTRLRLVADPAKPDYWQLTPAEVARVGKSLK